MGFMSSRLTSKHRALCLVTSSVLADSLLPRYPLLNREKNVFANCKKTEKTHNK